MRNRLLALLITFISLFVLTGHAAPLSYAVAVKAAAPAVVNVYTLKTTTAHEDDANKLGSYHHLQPILKNRMVLGSGVIMDSQGYILTNSHVIRDRSDQILVALSDGRTMRAELIGNDPETDLAVLKIAMKDLPVITLGNSEHLEVGDVVLAIGNPFGLGRTVTQGIISALGRTAVGLSNIENFIQTDVALNPGSSGGALINTDGKLIGINTGIYTRSGGYQGVSFAIPVNAAENILQQIIKFGQVKRGWLGAYVKTLTPMRVYELNAKQTMGVIVDRITKGSPAADKLQLNDIITKINGRSIHNANGFMSDIAQRSPGNDIKLDIYRNGQPHQVSITLKSQMVTDKSWHDVTVKGKNYHYPDDRL